MQEKGKENEEKHGNCISVETLMIDLAFVIGQREKYSDLQNLLNFTYT